MGYVLTIWSFGNSQRTYMFGKDIEDEKRALHNALINNDYSGITNGFMASNKVLKLDYRTAPHKRLMFMREYKAYIKNAAQIQNLERIEQLQQFTAIERLKNVNMPKRPPADRGL